MRKIMTKRSVKWGIALFCAVALTAGALAWGLGSPGQPGGTIATVDGTSITHEELENNVEEMKMMYQMQGQEITPDIENQLRQSVLNELISEILILNEAKQQGFEVSDEDIEEQYQAIVSQYEDEDQLTEILQQEGMTKQDLEEDISRQLTVQKFLDEHTEKALEEEGIEVSEEDKKTLYEQLEEQGQDLPDFEEIKPSLRENLIQEERQAIITQMVNELREDATIEIHQ